MYNMMFGHNVIWALAIAIYSMLRFRNTVATCLHGYIEFQSSCYFFADNATKTWQDARDFCRSDGGSLAEISSTEENIFIKEEASARSEGKVDWLAYWIGGTDSLTEQIWIWNGSGNVILFNDWYIKQPNNFRNQDCLSLLKQFQFRWNDADCERQFPFICEGTNYKSTTFEQTSKLGNEKEVTTTSVITTEMNPTMPPTTKSSENKDEQCTLFCIKMESLEELKLAVQELKLALSINKTNTSRYRRSLTSAEDRRHSARNIGCLGIVVIVSILCTVVAVDIIRIVNFFDLYKKKTKKCRAVLERK